jgi:hypothetical protein
VSPGSKRITHRKDGRGPIAVQSNGTIADQSGGISVTALGSGSYVIDFGEDVSGRALMAAGVKARNIADVNLCNGGAGVGSDCSPFAPNDNQHVGVNTALAATTPATFTDLPFYVAALPKEEHRASEDRKGRGLGAAALTSRRNVRVSRRLLRGAGGDHAVTPHGARESVPLPQTG